MSIKKIELTNFTVFEDLNIEFCDGINIFIGENATGKTHIMKLIYSACKATNPKDSFSQKIVNTFKPEDYKISRLISRKEGISKSKVKITAIKNKIEQNIGIEFNTKTSKWDADVYEEQQWETTFDDLESIFIPAKEILSNSYNIISANEKNNVEFDDTYIDILHSAKVDISETQENIFENILLKLEKIMDGKVIFDSKKDKFYIEEKSTKLEFNLVAEGIRKIALIWQLIKNGVLKKGSVLFWDEPEANINPIHIPFIVDMLLEFQRNGVQIFISTHDYTLSKYFDINSKDKNSVKFFSLYKTDDGVKCEGSNKFKNLEINTIRDTFIQLYQDEINMEQQTVNKNIYKSIQIYTNIFC